jgi:Protein of unknown function (DUF1517)
MKQSHHENNNIGKQRESTSTSQSFVITDILRIMASMNVINNVSRFFIFLTISRISLISSFYMPAIHNNVKRASIKGTSCAFNIKNNVSKVAFSSITNTKRHVFDKMFEEEGFLGKGITVGKVQIAVSSPDRSNESIFGLLEQAARSSDDSSEGLAETCHEVCMALLRKQQDWVSASSDSRWYKADDAGKAESQYNEWANTEAAKFEKVQ